MNHKVEVKTGDRLRIFGQIWKILSQPAGELVELVNASGTVLHSPWQVLFNAPDFSILGVEDDPVDTNHVAYSKLPTQTRMQAEWRERQVRQILFGRVDQNESISSEYNPDLYALTQRIEKKCAELKSSLASEHASISTIKRWIADYRTNGVYGLVDGRRIRGQDAYSDDDWTIIHVIEYVAKRRADATDVTLKELRLDIEERVKIENSRRAEVGAASLTLPGDTKLRELAKFAAPQLFVNAKRRSSISSNTTDTAYGHFVATRPGQIILLDFTPIDFLTFSEIDGSTLRVKLLLAQDLFSRAIVAWDLIEVDPKGVDASYLLLSVMFPKFKHFTWPEISRWHYVGIPETVILNAYGINFEREIANILPLFPETVVVDGGKVFLSEQMERLGDRFGINFIFARPYKGSDKSTIERLFLTIRHGFAEYIAGYVGENVEHRGRHVEPAHTTSELLVKIGSYITSQYNETTHDSCFSPSRPKVKLTPNQMLELGLKMQGFITVPASRNIYYESLEARVVKRIQSYGITIMGRRYDSDVLNPYRGKASPNNALEGKWVFLIDRRDPNYVFFKTLDDQGSYHAIPWVDGEYQMRPFQDLQLESSREAYKKQSFNNRKVMDDKSRGDRLIYREEIKLNIGKRGHAPLNNSVPVSTQMATNPLDRKERNAKARLRSAQITRATLLNDPHLPSIGLTPNQTDSTSGDEVVTEDHDSVVTTLNITDWTP